MAGASSFRRGNCLPALYTPGQIDGRSTDIVPCVASWTRHPNQAPTFRNQNQVWPVRVIRRGDAVRPLPPHARSLADLTFESGRGPPQPQRLHGPPPHGRTPDPEARRDRAGALRHGQRRCLELLHRAYSLCRWSAILLLMACSRKAKVSAAAHAICFALLRIAGAKLQLRHPEAVTRTPGANRRKLQPPQRGSRRYTPG
jgi:hypothetical protein